MADYPTNIPNFNIRLATEADTALILHFIKALAVYEQLPDAVVATEEVLRRSLFEKKQAEVIIGEYHGQPVAFALFFHNFSTFLGKATLYLEDLFVQDDARGHGFGQAMLFCLMRIALERDCERLDWGCFKWNTPSIAFYKSLGAKEMSEWACFRVEGETLKTLAHKGTL